jgi:tagatose 1,6-diphosphate aldolase
MLLDRLWRRTPPVVFHDLDAVGPTQDGSPDNASGRLSLIEPSPREAAAFVRAYQHPSCQQDPDTQVEPRRLLASLGRHPRGRETGERRSGCLLFHRFWLHLEAPEHRDYAGWITLRVPTPDRRGDLLLRYIGHVGYVVLPPARGRHLAARATRLLLPLAKMYGVETLSITCNPNNLASRRTIEAAGGSLVETVDLPRDHPLYLAGERRKCRYDVPVP